MKRAILTLTTLALAACVDTEGAKQTAEAYGFSDIVVTGTSWFGCSRDDVYATALEATNPQGDRVAAVVCAGGWGGKYGTLRIERIIAPARAEPARLSPRRPNPVPDADATQRVGEQQPLPDRTTTLRAPSRAME